eukprot:5398716-Pyramimonas_sp.AAC.1
MYTPNLGYKQFARRLKLGAANFRPVANKDDITSATLSSASIFVLGAPREKFSVNEFDAMKKYVMGGGS